ncbi:hypothetical protein GGS21DRAFT_123163 [Xylaria nigripes]|nr:hypothetical protein GGS21DRAFT_123163 [Xylaria nigripes]
MAADFFGVIAGTLGIIAIGKTHFPVSKGTHSSIRVAAALDTTNGTQNPGGGLPTMHLYDETGHMVGTSRKQQRVRSGEYVDISVPLWIKSPRQPTYALFGSRNRAICIAYMTTTWVDGGQYAWVGDWGHKCGGRWYYSNVYLSPSGITPDCFWISKNNTTPETGFQIHWPEFAPSADSPYPFIPAEKDEKAKYLCEARAPFLMHRQPDRKPNTIEYWPPEGERGIGKPTNKSIPYYKGTDSDADAASSTDDDPDSDEDDDDDDVSGTTTEDSDETDQTEQFLRNNLVVSNRDVHSAEELCASPTSFGPDFFNALTGTFCRMSDKSTWPTCNENNSDGCFNSAVNQLVINGVAVRDEPYLNIIDWTL